MFSQNCTAELVCSSLTYATQASLLDSMREQTTPFRLALEVNEIPNLLPISLVDEAKLRGDLAPVVALNLMLKR